MRLFVYLHSTAKTPNRAPTIPAPPTTPTLPAAASVEATKDAEVA